MFTSREHVFRSLNGGVNPAFPYAKVKLHCNLWFGDGDIDENGTYQPAIDVCDDWKPIGHPAASPAHLRPCGALSPRRHSGRSVDGSRVRRRIRGATIAPAATSR